MEGSESEAVFDSLKLNPLLFLNDVFNGIQDILNGAFNFYQQEASSILGDNIADKSNELRKGVTFLHQMLQTVLDNRLDMWEKYCLRHCFVVPEGLSHPKDISSDCSLFTKDGSCDGELDDRLHSLKEKLVLAGRETCELQRELCALEQQSMSGNGTMDAISEAMQLVDHNSMNAMFQEILGTASKLRRKMEDLRNQKREKSEEMRLKRICSESRNLDYRVTENLEEFLECIKNA